MDRIVRIASRSAVAATVNADSRGRSPAVGGEDSSGVRSLATLRASRPTLGWRRRRPRRDPRSRRRRWTLRLVVLAVVVLLLPVPWQHVTGDNPISHAWRLDGRLFVEDNPVDPPGEWSWLAVGRPALVGEILIDRIFGTDAPPRDMRDASVRSRPSLSEPAAVAVGLRHAGVAVPLGLIVEARDPLLAGYPDVAIISEVGGVALTDRAAWERASSAWEIMDPPGVTRAQLEGPADDAVSFSLRDGREFTAPGPGLPYGEVTMLDVAPPELDAGIALSPHLAKFLPVKAFRNLALGSSHGMMVALMTYAEASGHDLAQGRHIAGTGGILGDGTVTRIGGLPAKARAARRAGADVLLFPASQVHQLEGFSTRGMSLVPIETLDDAMEWLSHPVA